MATSPRAYQVTPALTLARLGLAEVSVLVEGAPAPEPLPCFGEVRAPIVGGRLVADPVFRLLLRDATVHGAEGVISVGRHVLAESLHHVRPSRAGAVLDGEVWMTRDEYVGTRLAEAEHLLYGNADNYSHWLLDGLGRSAVVPGAWPWLLPDTGLPHQRSGAGVFPEAMIGLLQRGDVVGVGRLGWTSTLTGSGGAFHPAIRRLGQAMSAVAPARGPERIFVSRRDAPQRTMRNQGEIEALCAARGYTPVVLTGMPVADQVALFGAARRVVAPHGAGLANLLFCRPGAAVLELFMDRYANFCFRRLAACAGLRYGCVLGRTDVDEVGGGDKDWVHGMTWTLDPARLAAVLDDPAFAPEEEL